MKRVPALDLRGAAGNDVWDLVSAALDDHAPLAIHETASDDRQQTWRVFFRHSTARDAALTALRRSFPLLTIEAVDVEDEDWARRSQRGLRAVRVGRLIVAPPWDLPPAPGSEDVVVIVEPSMGFGTGHHETTRLCLALLQAAHVEGRRVLDVGTGSGVLAIAAARLGARSVRGIDVDEDAIASARANATLNGLSQGVSAAEDVEMSFDTADLRIESTTADVVLANLTGAGLIASADVLRARVAPGGVLIVSGFLQSEAPGVLAAFGGMTTAATRAEGEWEAALLREDRRSKPR